MRRTAVARRREQQGQGTIEMVLTLFAFFTIFFMFVRLAMSFAVANYYQYVTYFAARAFLSGHPTTDARKQAALTVAEKMLKPGGKERFAAMGQGTGDGDPPGLFIGKSPNVVSREDQKARDNNWEQGVTYKFKVKMYMLPMVAGAKRGKANEVQLESQSWLGAEPTEQECRQVLEKKAKDSGVKSAVALFDNGC